MARFYGQNIEISLNQCHVYIHPFYLMCTNEYQMYNYINFYNDGRINKLKQRTKNKKKTQSFICLLFVSV